LTTDTRRPFYVGALVMSLTYRNSARGHAVEADRCEAADLFVLYRRHAERATECERKADAWQVRAFEVINGDPSDAEARERDPKWR